MLNTIKIKLKMKYFVILFIIFSFLYNNFNYINLSFKEWQKNNKRFAKVKFSIPKTQGEKALDYILGSYVLNLYKTSKYKNFKIPIEDVKKINYRCLRIFLKQQKLAKPQQSELGIVYYNFYKGNPNKEDFEFCRKYFTEKFLNASSDNAIKVCNKGFNINYKHNKEIANCNYIQDIYDRDREQTEFIYYKTVYNQNNKAYILHISLETILWQLSKNNYENYLQIKNKFDKSKNYAKFAGIPMQISNFNIVKMVKEPDGWKLDDLKYLTKDVEFLEFIKKHQPI